MFARFQLLSITKAIIVVVVSALITVGISAQADARSSSASTSYATDGTLDTTFGTAGITTTNITNFAFASSTAVQVDGKIVVVGQHSPSGSGGDFLVARYNTNGTLDATFGTAGITITNFGSNSSGNSVVIQADGKILVAGYSNERGGNRDFAVLRYNTSGTLDATFGTAGITTTNVGSNGTGSSMALQADGKILVTGHFGSVSNKDFAIVRYSTYGTLDATFGTAGITTTNLGGVDIASSIAIMPNGKILVAGRSFDRNFAIVRYDTNGTLDTTFGTAGITTTSFNAGSAVGNSMALQPDGKIIVVGGIWLDNRWIIAMARYNTGGTLDPSFGAAGTITTDLNADSNGNAVAVQPDGKIVVAGDFDATASYNYDFALSRYNANGTIDTTFDTDGLVTTNLGGSDSGSTLVMQADGKIVVVGGTWLNNAYQFALARYNTTPLAAMLATSSPTSSLATITFTLTGTETIDCATLSTVAGVDFNLTGITAITAITQVSPTECTISATSSATSDGVAVTSTLATSSSFSVGFTHGNSRSTINGASQSVIVTLPAVATPTPTATIAAPAATPTPTATIAAPAVTPTPTATIAAPAATPTPTATIAAPAATPTPTATIAAPAVTPTPTATIAAPAATPTPTTAIAAPKVIGAEEVDSLPMSAKIVPTLAVFGLLLAITGFAFANRGRIKSITGRRASSR